MRKIVSLFLVWMLLVSLSAGTAAAEESAAASNIPVGSEDEALLNNIGLAAQALDGAFVAYGDTFSFNDVVGPRTKDRGYASAVNGRGLKVLGGGVSQVATALYLALKQLDGIDYLDKKTYGEKFTGSYVSSGSDAIVTDYGAGVDFRFTNHYGDFTINLWTDDYEISCTLDDGDEYGANTKSGDSSVNPGPGHSSIPLDGSDALVHNIEQAAGAIGIVSLKSGDTFSFNSLVGPRTAENGYETAVNGRGAKVTGGGVAQVASAIWLAVKDMDNITVTEKSTYGDKYNQSYVDSADDAILVDYQNGTDFCFRYDGSDELSVTVEVQDGESILCEVTEG